MTPSRRWFSTNGSIMAFFVAISRIQLSDIMDIGWPSCGASGGPHFPRIGKRHPRLRVLLEGEGCLKTPGWQTRGRQEGGILRGKRGQPGELRRKSRLSRLAWQAGGAKQPMRFHPAHLRSLVRATAAGSCGGTDSSEAPPPRGLDGRLSFQAGISWFGSGLRLCFLNSGSTILGGKRGKVSPGKGQSVRPVRDLGGASGGAGCLPGVAPYGMLRPLIGAAVAQW